MVTSFIHSLLSDLNQTNLDHRKKKKNKAAIQTTGDAQEVGKDIIKQRHSPDRQGERERERASGSRPKECCKQVFLPVGVQPYGGVSQSTSQQVDRLGDWAKSTTTAEDCYQLPLPIHPQLNIAVAQLSVCTNRQQVGLSSVVDGGGVQRVKNP